MSEKFERIADWLQRVALLDVCLEELIEGLGRRLVEAGVPVVRISQGRLLMHPIIGVIDVTWDADAKRTNWAIYPRSGLARGLAQHEKSPFAALNDANQQIVESQSHLRGMELADVVTDLPFIHDDLTDPDTLDKYPLYNRLAASGITGYVALTAPFGKRAVTIEDMEKVYLGSTVSYATRRRSGFTPREVDGFRRINMPLMAALRIVTEKFFVTEVMEAYLGGMPSRAVLSGQIARGDVQRIECALLYSDMRGSAELSQKLSPEDYVAAINRYFDCVAGAVLEYGGEVLKFIGDGLLAIFPIDGSRRTPEDMCTAALSAAREAFQRRDDFAAEYAVEFGIALHTGEVIFGNVGTEKRLDFTTIGAAVAQVSRVEDMTKSLGFPLLATGAFSERIPETAKKLGPQTLRGFDEVADVVAYDIAD